jgi:SAM-dependent methyltransferase
MGGDTSFAEHKMEQWKRLEFEYAQRLRTSGTAERRALYSEAYNVVAGYREFPSDQPEARTAGISPALVQMLIKLLHPQEHVLEIGCGRGYTALMLAPHVASIIGTDVSDLVLQEASEVLAQYQRHNAQVHNVSALALETHFAPEQFTTALSIEVVEHLHPEDAQEHFAQVFQVLKPGGRYIIVLPSRLNGPHDITREEFPTLQQAIGFHLNESTYQEMVQALRKVGFHQFYSFHLRKGRAGSVGVLFLPHQVNWGAEWLYRWRSRAPLLARLVPLLELRLIAYKP